MPRKQLYLPFLNNSFSFQQFLSHFSICVCSMVQRDFRVQMSVYLWNLTNPEGFQFQGEAPQMEVILRMKGGSHPVKTCIIKIILIIMMHQSECILHDRTLAPSRSHATGKFFTRTRYA